MKRIHTLLIIGLVTLTGLAVNASCTSASPWLPSYAAPPTTDDDSVRQGVATTNALNIRAEASTKSASVGKLAKNERVDILDESGDWLRIRTSGGLTGWVARSYIRVETRSTSRDSRQDDHVKESDETPLSSGGRYIPSPDPTAPARSGGTRSGGTVRFGVLAGIVLARFNGADAPSDMENRLGLTGGGLLHYAISDAFFIQPELVYTQRGAVLKQPGGDRTLKLDYLELPILAGWQFTVSPGFAAYIHAGPILSIKLNSASVTDAETHELTEVSTIDAGVTGGLGIAIPTPSLRWILEVHYALFLTNIHDISNNPLDLKNSAITIRAGVML